MGLLYTQCLYNTGNQTSNMVMNSSEIIIFQAQNKCESGWGWGVLGGGGLKQIMFNPRFQLKRYQTHYE